MGEEARRAWPRRRFVMATMVLLVWIGFLSYQIIFTANPIVLSRPQLFIAPLIVEAELTGDARAPTEDVTVLHVYRGHPILELAPGADVPKDLKLSITNLKESRGWNGSGPYILALHPYRNGDENRWQVVPTPFSPGFHPREKAKELLPAIYPATTSTRHQLRDAVREP